MITYTFNNIEYQAFPEGDENLYSLTIAHRNLGSLLTKRPGNFTSMSNKSWEGQYKTFMGRGGRTLATQGATVAYLQWAGSSSIVIGGVEMRVTKPDRAEIAFGSKFMEAMSEVYEVIPQFSVLQGKYRIDFYIPETKQAFEYDERQHFTEEGLVVDAIRQKEIEDALGCVFIRIPH